MDYIDGGNQFISLQKVIPSGLSDFITDRYSRGFNEIHFQL